MKNCHTGDHERSQDCIFVVRVNDAPVELHEPEPKGEDLLAAAGFCPPHDYTLIQLLERESRDISPHQNVRLKGNGIELFRAFPGGSVFRYDVDGNPYAWGTETISEHDLRDIAAVPAGQELEQEIDGHWVAVSPDSEVCLNGRGVEKFRSVKRLITVFFDDEPRRIQPGSYSTEQLKELFGVQAGYELNVARDSELVTLKAGEHIEVCEGMRFSEQVPCGQSS